MKRSVLLAVAVLVLVGLIGPNGFAKHSDVGDVDVLRTYNADAGENPEGLAVDKHGSAYLSMPFIGDLRRIDLDGSEHLVTKLPTGNGFGPLGLAVDAPGNIYAGVVTFDAATQGVYRVTPEGDAERLPGSEAIGFANGLAFGDRGELYVTDSSGGAVWRIPRGGEAELWIADPLITGDNSGPLPVPIGANGVAFRHGIVYVTNTELGSVVAIPVSKDGSAGEASVLVQDPLLGGADGIALDVHGGLYVAVIAQSHILHISADGADIEVLADADDGLDYASSVAFGTSHGGRTTLYAVNFSIAPLFGGTRTQPPALLAIEAGVPGLPQP